MKTGFRGMHPVSGISFYILVFIFGMLSTHPISLISGFICALVYDIKIRGKKAITFALKFVLPFTLLSACINGFFNHNGMTVLFTLPGGNNFTLEAIVYGLIFALRAAQTLMWLGSFNEIMTNDRIIFLFGRFSPRIALLISMALRFIPLITEQASAVSLAQKGLGSAGASVSFTEKIKSGAKRLSILVSWTLERGIDTSDSMRARGYGLKGRTSYNTYVFSFRDTLFCIFLTVGIIIYIFSYKLLAATYNPVISIPLPDIFAVFSSVYFVFIMLLPFIIDVTEEKRWSISA